MSELEQRRKILGWRDSHCQRIESQLKHNFVLLQDEIGRDIDSATLGQLIRPRRFLETKVEPVLTNWIREQTEVLLSAAQKELNAIRAQQLNNPGLPPVTATIQFDTVKQDLGIAVSAAITAAVAVTMLVPSIVTTVAAGGFWGWLGLSTITVVSLPIVFAVVAIIAVASMITGTKLFNLRSKSIQRYRQRLLPLLGNIVLDPQRSDSLISLLTGEIRRVADEALASLDSA